MNVTWTVVLIVVLAAALTAACCLAVSRHRRAADAASVSVVVDGEAMDAAAVVWSVRQASHLPDLRAIVDPAVVSSRQVADIIELSAATMPLDQRSDFLLTLHRQEHTRTARALLVRTADSLVVTAGAAGADVLVMALGAVVGGEAVGEAVANLTPIVVAAVGPLTAAGPVLDVPGVEHITGPIAELVGQGLGEIMGAVVDAHVPVLTIASALRRAHRSQQNGLDSGRVTENLAWDVGARGGLMLGGATVGTMIFPGVGTAIGAVIGAVLGSAAAQTGKHRHLAEAHRNLMATVEELGIRIGPQNLHQIAAESLRVLAVQQLRHDEFEREAKNLVAGTSRLQRIFRPTVGGKVLERALELAAEDVATDRSMHVRLARTIAEAERSPVAKAYLWTAAKKMMVWQNFTGPDVSGVAHHVERVRAEQSKLLVAS